jgi:hypothetical protein
MTTRGVRALAAAAILSGTICASSGDPEAQRAETTTIGTASLGGVVLQDGQAAAAVLLTLSGEGLTRPLVATTDSRGRFGFSDLVPGDFRLGVRRPAYVTSTLNGLAWIGDEIPLALLPGRRSHVSLALVRGGAIEGVVRDPFGSLLPGATVTVFRQRQEPAQTPQPATTVTTDHRGRYRAYGLRSGEYLVRATARTSTGSLGLGLVDDAEYRRLEQAARESRVEGPTAGTDPPSVEYLPMYFGGTWVAGDAAPVAVAAGQEATGIDVRLGLSQSVTLRGVVSHADGRPARGSRVYLVPDQSGVLLGGAAVVLTDEEGAFVKERVTPGRYRLVAQATSPSDGQGMEGGALDVQVPGSDTSDLRVVVAKTHVQGHLHLDDLDDVARRRLLQTARVTLRRVSHGISISPLDIAQARVGETGSFVVNDLVSGDYSIAVEFVPAPAAGSPRVESITVGGVRVPDRLVRVTRSSRDIVDVHLSVRQAELAGTVRGWTGDAVVALSVLVFPEDPIARRFVDLVRLVQVQEQGSYRVRGLPAGRYLVALVSGVDLPALLDRATLDDAARFATPVRLDRDERRTLDLMVTTQP